MEIKELEQTIREKMAKDFLGSLTPEVKEEVLTSAVQGVMVELASSYKLRNLIDKQLTIDAGVYLEKYLKSEDVQKQLQEKAREAVDICMEAVSKSIANNLEHNMKSQYHNFIPTKEE